MKTKIRKPWLAGILSFLLPGLGHIYCGQTRRGIILYVCLELIALVASAIVLLPVPILGLAIATLIILSAYLYVILDSVKRAKGTTADYELKRCNKWYSYIGFVLVTALLIGSATSWATKKYYIQSYKIPSGAMIPTLEVGDYIFTNKFIYHFRSPRYGEVIIFDYPKEPKRQFIKRVVALGGDKVEIRNKELFVNGKKVEEDFTIHRDSQSDNGARDNFGPAIVPDESIFVLGDNRDQSYDSRFWGFATIDAVKGKAHSIYWSWDKENTIVRWGRIGRLLK